MTPPPIILYGYRESPFYQKLLLVLLFKQLPYSIVKTGRMPPRLALSDDLGITYRRIPGQSTLGNIHTRL
jgi:glutathione S-transferase